MSNCRLVDVHQQCARQTAVAGVRTDLFRSPGRQHAIQTEQLQTLRAAAAAEHRQVATARGTPSASPVSLRSSQPVRQKPFARTRAQPSRPCPAVSLESERLVRGADAQPRWIGTQRSRAQAPQDSTRICEHSWSVETLQRLICMLRLPENRVCDGIVVIKSDDSEHETDSQVRLS